MDNKMLIRIIHLAAFVVFLIQAQQSLIKYFNYPTVIQQTWIKGENIEKPFVQVCFSDFFDYSKASEYGYSRRTDYLSGKFSNSLKPTWKGGNGNKTIHEIQNQIYAGNFNQVDMSQINNKIFILNKGFCLEVKNLTEYLQITTKDKRLRVHLLHRSTDIKVFSNNIQLEFGSINNAKSDYKVYDLNYEIYDNTIHEGTTCFDYRKQKETYGACNYNALKNYIYSAYGCYPLWIMDERDSKICEIGLESKEIDLKLFEKVWKDIHELSDSRKINLLKHCIPPCYQVKCLLEKKQEEALSRETAYLKIHDEANNVPIYKAVYSFDIFMLSVELGSALGLWLGIKYILSHIAKKLEDWPFLQNCWSKKAPASKKIFKIFFCFDLL